MRRTRGPTGGIGGLPAGFTALILFLMTWTSLGAGQVVKDTKLAATIEGRKKIRVLTSAGERDILRPIVLADGVEGWAPGSGQSVRLSWTEIREIRVRRRGARQGLWIGSALGMGAGAAAGYILVHEEDLEDVTILIGAAGGLAAGALTGALVGSLFTGWRTVYTASAGSRPVPMISLAPTRGGGMALTLSAAF